jgi:putative permease
MKIILTQWINRYLAHEEALVVLLIFALAVVLLSFMDHVLAPIITAVVLAFLLQGVINRLERLGISQGLAVGIGFSLLLATIGLGLFVLLPSLWDQSQLLLQEMPNMWQQGQTLLELLPANYPQLITKTQLNGITSVLAGDIARVGQSVLTYSLSQFTLVLGLFVYLILVPTMVFFLLKDKILVLQWLAQFLPDERPVLQRIWSEMNEQIANYVRGKCVQIIVISAVSSVAFTVLGLNYALLLGVCMGLSVVIPYLGAAIVSLPVLLVGYFQWGWQDNFFILAAVVAIIHAIDGNILVPLLFSEAVKMHPLAIIIAILFFGGILGIWGVFFAIPLATLGNAILKAWPVHPAKAPQPCQDA